MFSYTSTVVSDVKHFQNKKFSPKKYLKRVNAWMKFCTKAIPSVFKLKTVKFGNNSSIEKYLKRYFHEKLEKKHIRFVKTIKSFIFQNSFVLKT